MSTTSPMKCLVQYIAEQVKDGRPGTGRSTQYLTERRWGKVVDEQNAEDRKGHHVLSWSSFTEYPVSDVRP